MAFPVIEARAESATTPGNTSHVVTKPTGTAAGDLWIIFLSKGLACTFDALSGYTELVDTNANNAETIWYRLCDGSEGTDVTFTASAGVRSSHLSYRISGAIDPAVQAPELSTVATGTSTTPNATTCTPTGGAKDYLWITAFASAGEEDDDDTWGGAAPTNYANALYKTTGIAGAASSNCSAAGSDWANNAASEDAGGWGANAQSLAWRAWTIAVHPNPGTFTGTAAVSIATMTAGGTATFVAPVYTGTAAVSIAAMTASGTATFVAPVYTGTAAVSIAAMTASGTATFDVPVSGGFRSLTMMFGLGFDF